MKPWISLTIPFGIQLPCLIVQLLAMRRSMKLSRKQMEELPDWIIENGKLWRINRTLVEWVKCTSPETYEAFVAACLSGEDKELLQIRDSDEDLTSPEK